MADLQDLKLQQTDRALKRVLVPARPPGGWIATIRSALGMTTRQLAKRMDITQSSVVALEKSEADEKISLATLRRAAEALDCDLQYVLVPRRPLADRVTAQAKAIAIDNLSRVKHTMRLEAQGTGESLDKRALATLTANLLARPWKHLWER